MLHSLVQFKPRDVPLRVALRNSAGLVMPLAAGIASGHTEAGLAVAAGALNTMFTDLPGPYRLRMQRMLLTALAAGFAAVVGSLLGASTVLVMLAALAWGIGGGLLVALGSDAGRAGMTSMILLVIMAADPLPLPLALAAGGLIFAGGLLQTVLAIAAWPLQRYRPEREALAALCRGLAASARRPSAQGEAPPVTQSLLDVERLLHGAHRDRGDVMDIFRILADLIERIRLELLSLEDVRAALADAEGGATIGRAIEYAARALEAMAGALDRGTRPLAATAALEGFDATQDALRELHRRSEDRRGRRQLAVAIARAGSLGGQLRAALRNVDIAGSRGELRRRAAESRLPRALRPRSAAATLRANLGFGSSAFRHALRCGIGLALGVGIQNLLGWSHGFWLPMTVAIVLKPDFAGTFRVGVLRVAGTLAGLALATALVHFAFGGEWERLALLAVLAIAFRMLVTMHYGVGVMVLTAMVVIMLSFQGVAPGVTMLARSSATIAGSLLALTLYALWPTRETERIRPALAKMLEAYRGYLLALAGGEGAACADARSTARSARTNAQASLDRLRDEPRHRRSLLALAEDVFANANRFVRASMMLEAALPGIAEGAAREIATQFTARLGAHLDAIAARLRDPAAPLPPSLREEERNVLKELDAATTGEDGHGPASSVGDALDRMTDSLDALAHLLRVADRPRRARAVAA
ncbi:MAG: FUSC family protein [Xanthomonadales bacterium]|nr:FUSC family protein [Xanthomonadales bacterium]